MGARCIRAGENKFLYGLELILLSVLLVKMTRQNTHGSWIFM